MLVALTAQAESIDGKTYTNFGDDLIKPIFPVNGTLNIYRNQADTKPKKVVQAPVSKLQGDWKSCIQVPADGWARCNVDGIEGWVKRAEFRSGGEIAPVTSWPFRYWLYVATDGAGSEETYLLNKAVRYSPYLVAPKEYDNIFFHVRFDSEGRAISPKTGKPTGDRVFVVGTSAYLAPEDPAKRTGATWLFLNHYVEKWQALCPSSNPDSCMSAVNQAPGWPGIKELYAEPAEQFRRKENDPTRWTGASWVAFARHADPVQPLMYRVPDEVHMRADDVARSDAEREKNRKKLFCIADCMKP